MLPDLKIVLSLRTIDSICSMTKSYSLFVIQYHHYLIDVLFFTENGNQNDDHVDQINCGYSCENLLAQLSY